MDRKHRKLYRLEEKNKRVIEVDTPVHVIPTENGGHEIVKDFEDSACLRCKCCVVWTAALQAMRDDIVGHSENNHSRSNRDPHCNVCLVAGGGIDNIKEQ